MKIEIFVPTGMKHNAYLRLVQDDIEDAIKEYNTNRETFHKQQTILRDETNSTDQLGERAPRFMCFNDVSLCAMCWTTFGTFGSSKNHCFACGSIVCSKCIYSLPLKYK